MAREYKDSGIEWIGRIPKDWKTERIKSLFSERNERDCQGKTLLSVSQYYGIRPKSETDLANSHIAESYDDYKEVHKGDFVMNIMLAWNGSYAVSDYDGIVSPAYCVFKFRKDYCKKYFHYLLRTDGYPAAFKTMSRGVIDSRLRLYPEQFYTFPVVIPPLAEQQRIASYLDKKCAEIDSLVELQEQMIAQLTDYKQSVITEAVTKGLNPEAELVPSGIDWIGDVPKGWKIMPLKWLLRKPLQYGANESGVLYDESLPRYVRITDILNNNLREDLQKLSLTEEQANGYILENNDILFARSGGTVGKAFIFKEKYGRCAFAGYLIRAQIATFCCSEFIYYYTQSRCYDEWKKQIFIQATIQNIGADRYSTLEVPIPPLDEQQSIASYLDTKCHEIDSLIELKRQKIEALKDYKKSVIFEAVTGKTDIINYP